MSRIISIGTAVPPNGTSQDTLLEFMQEAYDDDTASRKLKILFHHSGINTRYSVVPDFSNNSAEQTLFNGEKASPNIATRLSTYKTHALSLAVEAIENSLKKLDTTIAALDPTHLITVTCTGLYAPGLDTEIIGRLNLRDDIFHTSINFMGCNAAFPAMKLGDMITRTDENARVLIVCVELCTLHFQPKDNNDNFLSNTIFGDGAAAVIMLSDTKAKQNHQGGLSVEGFYSLLLSKGKDLMAWNITPLNFEMILDARIPDFIGDQVNNIVLKAGEKLHISKEQIDIWAIHPGGKKILDAIKKQLRLADADLQFSYKVLREYGNMSSPTILFVLNEIMHTSPESGKTIFSIGFGPGISIETALFTYAG
jgi:predicted naringenin-chalcone synthase